MSVEFVVIESDEFKNIITPILNDYDERETIEEVLKKMNEKIANLSEEIYLLKKEILKIKNSNSE